MPSTSSQLQSLPLSGSHGGIPTGDPVLPTAARLSGSFRLGDKDINMLGGGKLGDMIQETGGVGLGAWRISSADVPEEIGRRDLSCPGLTANIQVSSVSCRVCRRNATASLTCF